MEHRNGMQKHLGLRIDPDTLEKLRYIARYNGRSMGRHILFLIHADIRRFEREVDMIPLPEQTGSRD